VSAQRAAVICNRRGLHARAAAKFVAAAQDFDARIFIEKDGETVAAESIMDILMLGAGQGAEVLIRAEGADADAALDVLCGLVECGFEEED
jgi:phosphocarrier protein